MSSTLDPKRTYSADERREIIDRVLDWIAEGESLLSLHTKGILPVTRKTFYEWCFADEQTCKQLAHARLLGEEAILEQTQRIAEDTEEDPQSRKVRIWARMQYLQAWNPRRWAEQKSGNVVNVGVSVAAGVVTEEQRAQHIADKRRLNELLLEQQKNLAQ